MQAILSEISTEHFKIVQGLIYEYAGIALSDAKRVMVHSRLVKRLRTLRLDDFGDYLALLQSPEGASERIEFINCLTTNKTDFFRESHHFDFLKQKVFPALGRQGKLRIWSAACSSGEEPYSIAMCVRESFSDDVDALILATDIDTAVLARAKAGVYGTEQLSGVSNARLNRFFERTSKGSKANYAVKQSLRDIVKFGRLNFNDKSWPMSNRFDVIFCRNAMIYFDPQTQQRLVERFSTLINPGGYLIIGHSESLHGVTDVFEPLGHTIYGLKSSAGRPIISPTSKPQHPSRHGFINREAAEARPTLSPRPQSLASHATTTAEIERVSITLGQSCVRSQPVWITAMLGSCAAACVYDEIAGIGGVKQIMLPPVQFGEEVCSEWGNQAMQGLIDELVRLGAQRERLKAKLFGGSLGANRTNSPAIAGERNHLFVRKFLSSQSIPVMAQKTGGPSAMFLRFHTQTFEAQIKVLSPQISSKIETIESAWLTRLETI